MEFKILDKNQKTHTEKHEIRKKCMTAAFIVNAFYLFSFSVDLDEVNRTKHHQYSKDAISRLNAHSHLLTQ